MHWLINIMDTQGPQLVAMRAEAEERLNDRRIRQEQDAAYQVCVCVCLCVCSFWGAVPVLLQDDVYQVCVFEC